MSIKIHEYNNNESVATGYGPNGDGFTALTRAESKDFKTERGAIAWLAKRGYGPDGARLPQTPKETTT